MAPKAAAVQKEKIAVDKTFGMKNKNKSKQVQKYIKQITSNLTGQSGKVMQEERDAKAKKDNAQKSAAVMAGLFNLQADKKGKVYDPVAKKKAKELEEEAIAAGKKVKEDIKKDLIEGIANTIRLTNVKGIRMSELGGHPIIQALKDKYPDTFKVISLLLFIKASPVFWVDDPENNNPSIRCQEDVDGEVADDDRPIEEILDERRKALPPGGTPVTELSFQAWKEKRERQRIEEVQSRVDAAKKGGAKHVALLSGRDLFTYDASLFVDEDGAVSADEYDERVPTDDEEEDEDANAGRKSKKVVEDVDSDEEDEDDDAEGGDEEEVAGATGSGEAAPASGAGVAINKDLFLEGGDDLPDDLDDLDDD